MLQYARRFNKWYDKLGEPYRFLLFMLLANPPIVLIALDRVLVGGIWILLLVGIRIIK